MILTRAAEARQKIDLVGTGHCRYQIDPAVLSLQLEGEQIGVPELIRFGPLEKKALPVP